MQEKGKPESKPEVPTAVKPEMPSKPEKPELGVNSSKTPDSKPDAVPVIGPEPKSEVKPDVKPEVKPDIKPDVKPEVKPDVKPATSPAAGVGPRQAPSFSAADLDASLKARKRRRYGRCQFLRRLVQACGSRDVCEGWRRCAEAGLANADRESGFQSADCVGGRRLGEEALRRQGNQGGIVLAGTVTAVATKNGLTGTAIHVDGMAKAVMVFSAHALVKENQKVIVFGALVADPGKNLPGYPGKQPVVVWADFATTIP